MTPAPAQPGTSAGTFLRAVLSLVATLGLVAGVPVALVALVGWPLPRELPSWSGFTEALEQQGITEDVLISALAVVVWLAWAPLAWAIVVEAVAAFRGRSARRVHAWPGAQYLARKLVASATLLLSGMAGMRGAAAEPLDPLMAAVDVSSEELPGEMAAFMSPPPNDPLADVVVDLGEGSGMSSGAVASEAGGEWQPGTTILGDEGGVRVAESDGDPAPSESPVRTAWSGRSSSPSRGVAEDPEVVHEVEQGDSFWGLAEHYLGDGLRWREIRDHNVGREVAPGEELSSSADHLDVGWRIAIPGEVDFSSGVADGNGRGGAGGEADEGSGVDATTGGDEDDVAVPVAGDEGSEVTLRSGDHFWGLAERRLEEAWGRPVSAEEVAPYWQELIAANRDQIRSGDPDLVYPGELMAVPVAPVSPEGVVPTPAPEIEPVPEAEPAPETEVVPEAEAPAPEAEAEAEASEAGPEAEPAPPATVEVVPEAEPAPPVTRDIGLEDAAASEDAPVDAPAALDAADDEEAADDDSSPGIPVAVPFGASAALAGLLLLALARRRFSRRRSMRPGLVVEPRPEEDARLEREFAQGSQEIVPIVAAASRGYGAALAANPDLPLVEGIFVSPSGDVVLQLAEPASPEVPFEPGPVSDRWELYLDDLDLDPDFGPGPEPSVSVLDTPAVLGQTADGDWVFVDLESLGAVEVDGDVRVASNLVRSIVAELALQPVAERMVDLTVVGVDGLPSDVLEQGVVSFDHLDEDLVRRVERVADEADAVHPHRGAAARAQGLPRDGLFVTVVALGGATPPDPVLLERLAAAATPGGRGVAVIAVGPLGTGATRVLVDPSGDAHVPHLGVTVEAVQLAPEHMRRVERLLADEPEQYASGPEEAVPESWPEWPDSWSSEEARSVPGAWMGTWMAGEDLGSAGDGPPPERESGEPDEDPDPAHKGVNGQAFIDTTAVTDQGETAARSDLPDVDLPEVELPDEVELPEVELPDVAAAVADEDAGSGEVDGADHDEPLSELHVVSAPDVDELGPEGAAEPLDLREEPHWPDPGDVGVESGGQAEPVVGAPGEGFASYQPPQWEYCIRIFADHLVETPDGDRVSFRYGENPTVPNKNTHRGPELLAYLALSGRAATAEEVRDHMWWDRPVALGTVNKLLYGTRKVLGGAELLSHAQEDALNRYRLAPTVVTDAQLLAHALEHARNVANRNPDAAVDLLEAHLSGIEAVAFRNGHLGQGLMEWAAAYRVVDAVEQPVIEAALLMSRLSCERGRRGYMAALWGIDQGLRACPFNEALVRVAMEIEALLGNTDAVNHRYLTLATRLARDELEPEPETSELRVRLGGTSRLRSAG